MKKVKAVHLNKEVSEFLEDGYVNQTDEGRCFYYMPFVFEEIADGVYALHTSLETIPESVRKFFKEAKENTK